MRIHVKRGAVIHLFVNTNVSYCFEGAVLDMDDNEIILQPQQYIAAEDVTERGYNRFLNAKSIRDDITVDTLEPPLHISRDIIIGWRYCSSRLDSNTSYSGFLLSSEVDDQITRIRVYNDEGVCEGFGDYLE